MQIAPSDLKPNVVKYVDLAEKVKEPWYIKKMPEKITSVEQLFGTLPGDIDLDDVKTGRFENKKIAETTITKKRSVAK